MPRPVNKNELIAAAELQFQKLNALISSMSKDEQNADFLFEDRDKNVRDVMIHLYEWHELLINWIKSNKNGIHVSFLPQPYTWKTYPAMNVEFWKKHRETTFDRAFEMLSQSHVEAVAEIKLFNDDELFVKKYFSWTGTTNLGSYCISATLSHYDWAIKKIKKNQKIRTNK